MEYRDARKRQQRQARRRKREEDRWASLAGPVEVRRLDDEHQGEAEDEGPDRAAPDSTPRPDSGA